jgi:hypothetical protein
VRVQTTDTSAGQQRPELFAVPAPRFDDATAMPEDMPDCWRVPLKQLQLGSRDAIPRQVTDRIEQRRTERVVEEAGGQLSRVQLQVEADRLREFEPFVANVRRALFRRLANRWCG